jgi:anaerobic ribonucleoside-triphosphate reductase activating protein
MRVYAEDIVFKEIPDEVSLAFTISGCQNNCRFCHSPFLKEEIGAYMGVYTMDDRVRENRNFVTTILFMGGEHLQEELVQHLKHIREYFPELKTAWYCGLDDTQQNKELLDLLDYYKIGSYKEELGGLKQETTNQRLYEKVDGVWKDVTYKFWK